MKALVTLLFAALVPLTAHADPGSAAERYFAGLALIDQDGKPVDLYEDVMKGHVVVIHSFFTECKGSCPLMAGTFAYLQRRFANPSLRLISISADPEHDTPPRLKEYGKRLGAEARWVFLTGTREQVDRALSRIGQYAERPDAHSNLIIIANLHTGLWKKAMGLAARAEIAAIVQGVLDDKR